MTSEPYKTLIVNSNIHKCLVIIIDYSFISKQIKLPCHYLSL